MNEDITQNKTDNPSFSHTIFKKLFSCLIGRKLGLFGHICRKHNSRRIKELMFRGMEGANRRGRPHREWLDDITEWGKASLKELSQAAMDRKHRNSLAKMASDTNWGAELTVLDDDV